MNLADRLIGLRKDRDWSTSEVAKRCGVSRTMWFQIEHSQSSPTLTTLEKIAAGFELNVIELLAPLYDVPTAFVQWDVMRGRFQEAYDEMQRAARAVAIAAANQDFRERAHRGEAFVGR